MVSLAELGASRCQRGRQGRLEWQGAQGVGGNREPKASPYQFHHGQHPLLLPRPMANPSSTELPIQEATVDLLRWFTPMLYRLPRQHRHGLGERLQDFQLIDLRRYEHASRLITAVGRQHSAWLAQQRRPA